MIILILSLLHLDLLASYGYNWLIGVLEKKGTHYVHVTCLTFTYHAGMVVRVLTICCFQMRYCSVLCFLHSVWCLPAALFPSVFAVDLLLLRSWLLVASQYVECLVHAARIKTVLKKVRNSWGSQLVFSQNCMELNTRKLQKVETLNYLQPESSLMELSNICSSKPALHDLGWCLWHQGRKEEGEQQLRTALEIKTKKYSQEHPSTAES